MKTRLVAWLAIVFSALLASQPIFAHHSMSIYDMSQTITLKATIENFDWSNPHVQIHFDVKDEKGNVEEWLAECPSPNRMSRTGWYKDALRPQDEITITGNPTKDGSKSIRLEKVLFPNGSTLIGRSR
jgi:hypothetical protein